MSYECLYDIIVLSICTIISSASCWKNPSFSAEIFFLIASVVTMDDIEDLIISFMLEFIIQVMAEDVATHLLANFDSCTMLATRKCLTDGNSK